MKPHCPQCKSTEKPHSKITGLKGTKTLIVYCSSCGCILGAINHDPQPRDENDSQSDVNDTQDNS